MTEQAQLDFALANRSLVIAAAVILVTAALGWRAWHRSGYSTSRGCQELLRLAIVSLVGLLLCQPEWIEHRQDSNRPTVLVLWDDSPSMQTQDVLDQRESRSITRAQSCALLLDTEQWMGSQQQSHRVVIEPIGAAVAKSVGSETGTPGKNVSTAKQTNLHQPLLQAVTAIDRLLAVILISDGDWNSGRPPVEAAAKLRQQGVPVHTVAVGSQKPLPDVELASVDPPSYAVVGKPLRIPVAIDSSLPRPWSTEATLRTADGIVMSAPVTLAPLGRTSITLEWTPEEIGDYELTVTIPGHAGETIATNNTRSVPISIRNESLSVLIVESYPRWEYRYLRNALSRDPGVKVACLLFQPGLSKVGGGSTDYLSAMPETIEALSRYDVVFLGDVGAKPDQLTRRQCENLRGLVEQQAAGLVFLPGAYGHQFDLSDTPLGELIPVAMDREQPGGWGLPTPDRFALTEAGRQSLLTRLADNNNADVWENLPGFQWYAPVLRAKAGSQVLAVHGETANQHGRLPLIVTRTSGSGKVLFMGTDGAWRWRKGVEDKYHYRFWGQVVRWMAYQRNMAAGESMRLIYQPDAPQVDQTMTLRAHVMDQNGEPLSDGHVTVMAESPSGRVTTTSLQTQSNDSWGVYEGRFMPTEPGTHEFTVESTGGTGSLKTSVYVQGIESEPIGKPARPDVLAELSRLTGAIAVKPDGTKQISAALGQLPPPPEQVRRIPLWSHPLSAALLITLLGIFWTWRKTSGLV